MNGINRPPVQLLCSDGAPCSNVTLANVNMWSQSGTFAGISAAA
jgi:rhamnogalacturonan hydrolase